MKDIEWAETALQDMAALDKAVRFDLYGQAIRVLRVRNRREAYR